MIFVSIGNHDQEFTRLIKRIDEIAPKVKEKIIVQRGHTKYKPVNCESFEWSSSLDDYMKKASLIILHAGIGTSLEVLKKYKKSCIVVPRQHKYGEHINDHQVDFAEVLEKKGVKVIYEMGDLDEKTLNRYRKVVDIRNGSFNDLQGYLKKVISEERKRWPKD